ncbi:uncharacterized protein BKA78DRAFT_310348 [Phyllosticta capitalensis]|uniref:uncharacterized protein n=1 Tax=Phyllosticta capitalensis TaxID=121624 RepID=UPI00312E00F8
MSHKRKRSSDSTASPLSSSSLFSRSSSPPCIDMDDAPILPGGDAMGGVGSWGWPAPVVPRQQPPPTPRENVSGRCLKRFRDDRPDERIVHESTLRRLYDAQRAAPHASLSTPLTTTTTTALPSPSPQFIPTAVPLAQFPQQQLHPVQKSTLHQFWHISKPPPPPQTINLASLKDTAALRCEDCDVSLVGYYGVGVDMDVELDECVCAGCGRWVCASCAVWGDERRCAGCAAAAR